jgi:hypothetical protein
LAHKARASYPRGARRCLSPTSGAQHSAHHADANAQVAGNRQLPLAGSPSGTDGAFNRRRQPIHAPRHDHVEPAARRVLHEAVEGGALVAAFRATDAVVDVLVHDLPAGALGYLPQCEELRFRVLMPVSGRDSGVDGRAFDGCRSDCCPDRLSLDLQFPIKGFCAFGRPFPEGVFRMAVVVWRPCLKQLT